MIDDALVDKFSAVYADAVLTYLETGEPQFVTWDGQSSWFDYASVLLGTPRQPVMLAVDEGWIQVVGDLPAEADPQSERFDEDELREAIVHQLALEGYGERLLAGFQKRLEKVRELAARQSIGEADPDAEAGEDIGDELGDDSDLPRRRRASYDTDEE